MAIAFKCDRLSTFKPMDIDARIEELIDAPWQTVKAAAEAVGVGKGEGTWNDMADEIAQAEAAMIDEEALEAQPPEVDLKAADLTPPTAKVATAPDWSNNFFYKAGIDFCKSCGAKRAKHADGTDVICCDNPQWQY